MRSYLADFNRESGADAVDLAAAMAGYENGRNRRFLNYTDSDYTFANRGKEKSDDLVDFILTQNVDYDALFENTMGKVRGAEDAVDRVLDMAAERLAKSGVKLETLIDQAAELPDGTKVAKDKHGTVLTLDGEVVAPELSAQIEWTGHEPSIEDIDAQRAQTKVDLELLNTAYRDEARLGEIREEMTSEDKPSADRVRELNEEAGEIKERNTKIIEAQNNQNFENENQMTNIDFSNSIDLDISR